MTTTDQPDLHLSYPQPVHIHPVDRSGSPRLLTIARDVLLSVMALLVSLAIIWAAVVVNRAGDALSELGTTDTSTSAPCPPENPYCVPIGD